MASFPVKDGGKFLLVGDSITDCGRRGQCAPLGEGYVAYFVDIATSHYPERRIDWINKGIGGNVVLDLDGRWTDDVLRHEPDWLSVMIGINDIHRTLAGGEIPPQIYAETYDHILSRVPKETRLVLLDPFYISTEREADSPRRRVLEVLPEYLAVVDSMAVKYEALHVRTHAMFQEQLKHRPCDAFGDEPVHPNATGHLMIAHEWLESVDW